MRIEAEEVDTGLDMTPMIDCVFLLLIFFLVATTMKKPEEEIKVELPPPAVSARATEEAGRTEVTIDAAGAFYLDGKPAGQGELHEALRRLGATNPAQLVRITTDRAAPSQYLVQVIDLCAFEGLRNYAIHTSNRRPRTP